MTRGDFSFVARPVNGPDLILETLGIDVHIEGLPQLVAVAVDEKSFVSVSGFRVVDGDQEHFLGALWLAQKRALHLHGVLAECRSSKEVRFLRISPGSVARSLQKRDYCRRS